MSDFDLDAKRAARREALGDPKVITWAGVDWELPVELPYEVLEQHRLLTLGDLGAVVGIVKALLGDEWDAFVAAKRPSMQDCDELVGAMLKLYGLKVIEAGDEDGGETDPLPSTPPAGAHANSSSG